MSRSAATPGSGTRCLRCRAAGRWGAPAPRRGRPPARRSPRRPRRPPPASRAGSDGRGRAGGRRLVAEQDRADAPIGRRHQHAAERTPAECETDAQSRAPLAEGRRRHAEPRAGIGVEPARGVEAGLVDGFGHRRRGLEAIGDPRGPARGGIGMRCDARARLEQPMEVKRAEAGHGGQTLQRGRALRRLDQPHGAGEPRRVTPLARCLVRMASLAGTEARGLRLGGAGVGRRR